LQGAVDALAQPGIDDISPALRHAAIFDRAASAEYLGSLLVLGPTGDIIADSTSIEPHRLNLSERDYFQVHRDRHDVGLFVSRPFRSKLRNGSPSISISRRLQDKDGHFAGVVVGTLKLDYFSDMFGHLNLGDGTAIVLMRTDGHMVTREPPSPGDLDRDLSGSPLQLAVLKNPVGGYLTRSIVDGIDRWMTYRQIGSLPLLLGIATSIDAIYAAWWQKALGIGTILLVLSGAIIVLILLFRREMVRRMRAEDALFDAASRLSVIAATDGLTGLANRRSFEADLQHEWKRAVRGRTTLALLLLDADWFKPFNDRYGHVEGDEVLRRIAGCIERSIRRPGDVAARYGGEEFVALLPETELPGATFIAERICAAVAALAIPHDGSPLGHVTVSIGVAITRPSLGDTETDLVRNADLALYAAKRNGRARVCVTPDAALDQAAAISGVSVTSP
jgi:diguanylate cyclase (GGDEF)-like protein